MIRSRREYSLAKDQPILERARRRTRARVKNRSEADFWLLFDLERFATFRKLQDQSRAERD